MTLMHLIHNNRQSLPRLREITKDNASNRPKRINFKMPPPRSFWLLALRGNLIILFA